MRFQWSASNKRQDFTLVELAVVIVIIGRFLKSIERSRAGEAVSYLSAVCSSQERYQSQNGSYASDLTTLDLVMATPKYFTVGTPAAGGTGSLQDSWTLTLTRAGASAGYGAYTVVFTQDGFDKSSRRIARGPE